MTVILSDIRISSPVLRVYDTAILLNQQSIDKFESSVKPGGLLLYDGNGISRHPERKDINIWRVDAAAEAATMGSTKVFNMIVLGAYLQVMPVVKLENVMQGLGKSLPKRYHHLLAENEKAILRGHEIVQNVSKPV